MSEVSHIRKTGDHDNIAEMQRLLDFPTYEAGIRVEKGIHVMMMIDRLRDLNSEDDRRVKLYEILG